MIIVLRCKNLPATNFTNFYDRSAISLIRVNLCNSWQNHSWQNYSRLSFSFFVNSFFKHLSFSPEMPQKCLFVIRRQVNFRMVGQGNVSAFTFVVFFDKIQVDDVRFVHAHERVGQQVGEVF